MNQPAERVRLPHLEAIGDATPFAAQIHTLIERSPLFENFNLAEIRLMSHFMQVYRADSGMELVREGEAGDFMMLLIVGRIEVFKQDRWNAPRLIAVLDAGQTVGEMSMIDGEPRFATCMAAQPTTFAVLTRDSMAVAEIQRLGRRHWHSESWSPSRRTCGRPDRRRGGQDTDWRDWYQFGTVTCQVEQPK